MKRTGPPPAPVTHRAPSPSPPPPLGEGGLSAASPKGPEARGEGWGGSFPIKGQAAQSQAAGQGAPSWVSQRWAKAGTASKVWGEGGPYRVRGEEAVPGARILRRRRVHCTTPPPRTDAAPAVPPFPEGGQEAGAHACLGARGLGTGAGAAGEARVGLPSQSCSASPSAQLFGEPPPALWGILPRAALLGPPALHPTPPSPPCGPGLPALPLWGEPGPPPAPLKQGVLSFGVHLRL